MKLSRIFSGETIIPELNARTKAEAIEELVGALHKAGLVPRGRVEELQAATMRREELGSTGIGHGVAAPHVKHACASEIIGAFGRSRKGIPFQALDGEPVDLIFMLVSPLGSVEPHLQALKKVSALSTDSDLRRFLREAADRSELVELMKEADERL